MAAERERERELKTHKQKNPTTFKQMFKSNVGVAGLTSSLTLNAAANSR